MNVSQVLQRVTLWLRRDQVEALDEAARIEGPGNRSAVARQVFDLGLAEMRRLAGQPDEGRS